MEVNKQCKCTGNLVLNKRESNTYRVVTNSRVDKKKKKCVASRSVATPGY